MACTTCYKDWIHCGETSIEVLATLLPETNYTWILTSAQGAKYLGAVKTDADGHFLIEEPVEGLFNPYAGFFTLEVQTGNCSKDTFNNSAYCEPYSCIEFESINGNGGKNTIGCPCLEEIDGCSYPTIESFTDQESLVIPYTAEMVLKYGDVPTVQVWIYDGLNRLVNVGVSVIFDAVPVTEITIDFGGISSGLIVIK
jgi:hypothetical protein